ncbi:MAG: DEAD/DEAH box helicase, partial [Holophagales bacterium]|nr:DEAD/DEAH box helicase [Holophagales bacterium]
AGRPDTAERSAEPEKADETEEAAEPDARASIRSIAAADTETETDDEPGAAGKRRQRQDRDSGSGIEESRERRDPERPRDLAETAPAREPREATRRQDPAVIEIPADEQEPTDDESADGLFTGAIPQEPVETTDDTFESPGLSSEIIETLDEIGFHHPTPIQASVLPMALEGSDIIGLAETGSGKTGAFGLPMAQRLTHGKGVRGLILCPTREIALQTKAFLDVFGRNHSLETAVVIGGVQFGPQIDALRRKPDIIVATPGRLADHMRRRNVSLRHLEELVLDEADHMLDLGFLPQIQEILEQVPEDRRTMMFSATMPPLIERLAQRFLDDPYLVDLRPVNRVAAGIEHRLYLVKAGHEKLCLVRLLEEEDGSTLVFARRKLDTEWLSRQLSLAGLPVDRIHSDRSQAQRVRALRGFREGKTRILVATDVAARGIDVPRLSHVINFGVPDSVEDYIHRAGRTARGKAVGTVSTIGTWQDKIAIRDVERVLGHPIQRHELEGVEAYREPKKRKTVRRRRLL